MKLSVEFIEGQKFFIDVSSSFTVDSLKNDIALKINIPISDILIIFQGKELCDTNQIKVRFNYISFS